MTKAGAQAWAAKYGVALVFPDTSPRGDDVANDDAFDLGQGAGFYVDATQKPWAPFIQESFLKTGGFATIDFSEAASQSERAPP